MDNYGSADRNPLLGGDISQLDTEEWDNGVKNISKLIFQINSNSSELSKYCKLLSTKGFDEVLREKIRNKEKETTHLIFKTGDTMKFLIQMKNPRGKLQMQRVERLFREASDRYKGVQKSIVKSFEDTDQAPVASNPFLQGDDEEQSLLSKEQMQAVSRDDILVQVEEIRDREERIVDLEKTVTDVNEMFKTISELINEQGQVVDTIENNIQRAHDSVEDGTEELATAATYQKKAMKKTCILVGILAAIAVVLAIVIYFSVKK